MHELCASHQPPRKSPPPPLTPVCVSLRDAEQLQLPPPTALLFTNRTPDRVTLRRRNTHSPPPPPGASRAQPAWSVLSVGVVGRPTLWEMLEDRMAPPRSTCR